MGRYVLTSSQDLCRVRSFMARSWGEGEGVALKLCVLFVLFLIFLKLHF